MDIIKGKKKIGDYILISKIGKGAFASVYGGINQKNGKIIAIKQIEMSKINKSKETYNNIRNEFFILSKINHNNIIKLIDYELTKNNIYFILDYCNGGNLSEYIKYYEKKEGKLLNEFYIQKLLRQLIKGLEYMHNKNIIHRDLKLENILLNFNDIKTSNLNEKIQKVDYSKVSLNDSFTLKIADLGFSKNISKELYTHTFLGTPIIISPEVLLGNDNERKYNTKADLWSLGIITYQLLIGYPPFNSNESIFNIFKKIKIGKYKIPTNIKISIEAISFINGLLQFYPEKRFNWEQIKSHPFIINNVENFHYINLKNMEYNENIVIDSKNCDNLLWINFENKLNIGLDKIDQNYLNETMKNDNINEGNKENEKISDEDKINEEKKENLEYKNENLNNNKDKLNEGNKENEKKSDEDKKIDKEEKKNNLNNNKDKLNEGNKEIEKKNEEEMNNEEKKENLEYKNENLNNNDNINEGNKENEKKSDEDKKIDNEEKKNNLNNNKDKLNEENQEIEKKNEEEMNNEKKIKNLKDSLQNNLNINELNNNDNYEINNFSSFVVIINKDKNENKGINIINNWIEIPNNDEKDEISSINLDLDYEVEDTFEDLDIDENYINNFVK